MTLFELVIALSLFGSAIVGLASGTPHGWCCCGFGIIAGPIIGALTLTLLMGVPFFAISKTSAVTSDTDEPASFLHSALALVAFAGSFASVPVAWAATSTLVDSFGTWLAG